jgi:hypothetical protein
MIFVCGSGRPPGGNNRDLLPENRRQSLGCASAQAEVMRAILSSIEIPQRRAIVQATQVHQATDQSRKPRCSACAQ